MVEYFVNELFVLYFASFFTFICYCRKFTFKEHEIKRKNRILALSCLSKHNEIEYIT